jgi:DNA polymerase III alpha subunit
MDELLPNIVDGHLLWLDGSISVSPDEAIDYIFKLSGKSLKKLHVTEMTPEIAEYNTVSDQKLTVKTECDEIFPPVWNLPAQYETLDLDEYLLGLIDKVEHDDLYEKRVERLSTEIWMFKQLQLDEVLRMLIYVIDTLQEKNIVWGVGRGSSCSSYLLYLLGLHEVDSVKYEIEISDFISVGAL